MIAACWRIVSSCLSLAHPKVVSPHSLLWSVTGRQKMSGARAPLDKSDTQSGCLPGRASHFTRALGELVNWRIGELVSCRIDELNCVTGRGHLSLEMYGNVRKSALLRSGVRLAHPGA